MLPYTMNHYWLLVLVPAIMLSGLAIGMAVSEEGNTVEEGDPVEVVDPVEAAQEQLAQEYMSQPRLLSSHRDAQSGDCTLNIVYDEFNFANTTTTVMMSCSERYGGGSGGGGFEGMEHLSLYNTDRWDRQPRDYLDWEVVGMQSCSFHAQNMVWVNNDDAPNTVTIVMNCWWQEDKKIELDAVAEVPPFTPEFLANHTRYAIHGIVTGIETQPVEFDQAGVPNVFTHVRIAVFEDLKGIYDEAFMVIRVQGGETDEYRSTVEGSPMFELGETVLVFVDDKEPDSIYGDNYYVAGLQNGKYTILGSGLAISEDSDRTTTFDELKTIIKAALADGTVRDELPES